MKKWKKTCNDLQAVGKTSTAAVGVRIYVYPDQKSAKLTITRKTNWPPCTARVSSKSFSFPYIYIAMLTNNADLLK